MATTRISSPSRTPRGPSGDRWPPPNHDRVQHYLGLTTDPRVRKAAMDAVEIQALVHRLLFLNGTLSIHVDLERRLAEFVGKEAALVFSTGYQSNLGAISAIVGRGDVITDREDHASIIDGCLLSRGEMKRFQHNDLASLEKVLASCDESAGKLVVVDGVYSMGGDIAPCPRSSRCANATAPA